MKYITTVNDQEFEVEILDERHVAVNGRVYEVDMAAVSGQPLYSLLADHRSFEGYVYEADGQWQVLMGGTLYEARVEDEQLRRLRLAGGGGGKDSGPFLLKAPMPGLVVSVPVTEGQEVKKGDVLVVLESMKMQNELKSPKAGKVEKVKVSDGQTVDQGEVMVTVV
ncbi:MAG TPA: acetyl-CoA carboxylase biotin carboxyl carrier protein subunit [Chloroflexi bacterium]|nr:acetyl-CoA carboxylase biotin carboxyl carrier protein subunit [Chloroflexota bacterium]